jgi:hypothetical protein
MPSSKVDASIQPVLARHASPVTAGGFGWAVWAVAEPEPGRPHAAHDCLEGVREGVEVTVIGWWSQSQMPRPSNDSHC